MSAPAGHPEAETAIVTPDRRLRIFVSSTLEELSAERVATRDAVLGMHLAPVMFELGARPHPPRKLYEAYLRQSDVFVGVYWQRYGWVAPDMEISGLEDEYQLSKEMPRLIYVREPAPDREPRLTELLERVMREGRSSFKLFSTPEQLASLVADDLAVMMTERFASRDPAAGAPAPSTPLTAVLVADLGDAAERLAPSEHTATEEAHHRLSLRLRDITAGKAEVVDLGDAMLGVFPLVTNALAAAVALQRWAAREPPLRAVAPEGIRVGIHGAETVEGDHEHLGWPLAAAKRLCGAAAAGQILITDAARAIAASRLTEGALSVERVDVAGVPEAIGAFSVAWATSIAVQYPPPPELATPSGSGVFVGRTDVSRQLRREWERASAGERRLACIAGEPGIGKTRLARDFASAVHREGALVLWGRSWEEVLVPYQPFVQALRHYVESRSDEDLRVDVGSTGPVLGRLVPSLLDRFRDLPPAPGDEPESQRHRLFDAVSVLLAKISSTAPVLLVLDDLQWADQASLLLLAYLLRDARPAALLIVGTYRDTEVTGSHPLKDLLADARREERFLQIHLGGLDAREVSPMIESLTGWVPTASLATSVVSQTQGNPFFIGEVVRHLHETGAATETTEALSLEDVGVPEGAQQVVARRLQRLSPDTVTALRTASVIGATFDTAVLQHVAGFSDAEVVAAMDEAIANGLVVQAPGGPGQHAFPHALIRYALYDSQTALARSGLHLRAAEALEALYSEDLSPHLAALVEHYSLAPDRYAAKVAAYARAAGERALSMLAYEDAVSMLTTALDATATTTSRATTERAETLVALGAAHTRSGSPDDARASLSEAAAIASTLGDRRLLAEAALGYGSVAGFGGVWITFGEIDQVLVRFLEQALAEYPPDDHPLRARLLARLAQALYWAPDRHRMLPLSAEALAMARRMGDRRALAHAVDSRHVALWDADHLDEREDLAAEMLALGEELDDRDVQLEAYAWLITDALERGRMDLVDRYVAAHVRLADELHQPYHLWYSRVAEAMQAQVGGRYDDMERLLAEAWGYGERSHGENALQTFLVQTLVLKTVRDEAAEIVDAVAAHAASSPLWAWWAAAAYTYAQVGRLDDAADAVSRLSTTGLDAVPKDCLWLSMMAWVADVVARSGDPDRAAEVNRLLLPYADRVCGVGGGVLSLGPVARYLGVLCRTTGRLDDSVTWLDQASAKAEALGSPPEIVAAQVEKVRTLLLRGRPGDATEADRLVAQARTAAHDGGMIRLQRELAAFHDPGAEHQLRRAAAGAPAEPAPAPSGRPVTGARPTAPMVERAAERADIVAAANAAKAGRGALLLVSGEAGVGKTRLMDEALGDAAERGVLVVTGHCVAMTSPAPYLPFVEMLEQLLLSPTAGQVWRDALGDDVAEIARIVPMLHRVISDVPPPLDLPAEQARRFLWSSICGFLERVAATRPLVMVAEDLHWADVSTLSLIEHLAPRLAMTPILLLGSYRDDEVGPEDELTAMLGRLSRRHLARHIVLEPLSHDGVREMLQGLAGHPPPHEVVSAIMTNTEGNPLFVEEIFIDLVDRGGLLDDAGAFLPSLFPPHVAVPEDVRLLVSERLARLGPDTASALLTAAVIGRSFDPLVLQAATALSDASLVEALDDAEHAHVIEPISDGARLAFTHELIRQSMLAATSSVRRQEVHRRVAEAIEQVWADDLEPHAAELAYHLSSAGPTVDDDRLVRHLVAAGDQAMRVSAFSEAVERFETALTHAPRTDRTRADVLERLAFARRGVGAWDAALQALDEALTLYRSLGDVDAFGRLCRVMVYQLTWGARFEEAGAIAQRGLQAIGDAPSTTRARLLCGLGWAIGLSGDYPRAKAMYDEALDLATQLADAHTTADVLHGKTMFDFGFARFTEGIASGREAATEYERSGALWDLCSVQSFTLYLAGTTARRDLHEEAAMLASRVLPVAERLGHLGAVFLVLADRTRREGVMGGDLELVERLARKQIDVCERGDLPWLYTGYLYLGFVANWRGDAGAAEQHLRRAVELEPPGVFSGQALAHLALVLAEAGHADEVATIHDQLAPRLPHPDETPTLGAVNAALTMIEALYVCGRRSDAAALAPLAEACSRREVEWMTFDARLIRTRAGIAAAAGGRWTDAAAHYGRALTVAQELGDHVEEADVQRLHAEMLLERGEAADRDQAAMLLGSALMTYRKLRMPRYGEVADALLQRALEPRAP
jgi:predicted ATPase